MLLHILMLGVVAIWMIKIAEKKQIGKNYAVLLGAVFYLVFTAGIHYCLFVFGDDIYNNHRLVFGLNIASGLLGASIAALILNKRH